MSGSFSVTARAASSAADLAFSTSTSMLASLCLTAWNDPIGRPNWNLVLAYLTVVSRANSAPPTCSAASATAAMRSVRRSAGQACPAVPMSLAGVDASSTRASFLVRSMVGSEWTLSPAAPRSTANSDTPASLRAATRIRVATCASGTNRFTPLSSHPPPDGALACAVIASASQPPCSSLTASVAMVSPLARPGRYAFFASSSPASCSAVAASATVAKNGDGSRDRPISPKITQLSAKPKPLPPYSSGMDSPCRPSCSPICRQTAGSYPSASSISARTAASSDRCCRKRRIVCRSSSRSSAVVMGISLRLAAGDLGPRLVLVDPEVRWQAENAFGEDVSHDLRRAAFDRVGPGAQEGTARVDRGLPPLGRGQLRHVVGVVEHALVAQDVEAEVVALLVGLGEPDLADRPLRARHAIGDVFRGPHVAQRLGPRLDPQLDQPRAQFWIGRLHLLVQL